jgi:hypothetical protein
MRQGPNGRRPRSRHHSGGPGGGGGSHNINANGNPRAVDNRPRSASSLRHQTFDSNCIDVRVRGNAWQVHEKYQALARDAQSSGDRVSAEHYLQHAEHYYRIIEAINEATAAEQSVRGAPQQNFNQQPDMPAHYFGAPAATQQAAQQAAAAENGGNVTPMAQAEVQPRVQPQPQPNPFFAPEEMDENGNPMAAVARR